MNDTHGDSPDAVSRGVTRREAMKMGGGLAAVALIPLSDRRSPVDPAYTLLLPDGRLVPPPSHTTGRPRFFHTAIPLRDGRILIAGGETRHPLSSVELFDPLTGQWSDAEPMRVARSRHAAASLPDGRILVIGGYSVLPLAGVEIFDPAGNSWSDGAPLPSPRFQHAAVALPTGHILVTGGYHNGPLSSTVVYDPSVDRWSKL